MALASNETLAPARCPTGLPAELNPMPASGGMYLQRVKYEGTIGARAQLVHCV